MRHQFTKEKKKKNVLRYTHLHIRITIKFVKFERNAIRRQMNERIKRRDSLAIAKGMRLPKCLILYAVV